MFKVIDNPEFSRKVAISVPVNGGFENQSLGVRFRVLSQDRIAAILEATPGNFLPLVNEMVVSLEDLADVDGQPLAYNDAVRAAVLDMPFVRTGILGAYSEAVSGAKRGN